MNKKLLKLFAGLLIGSSLAVGFSACENNDGANNTGVEGLAYTVNADGKTCTITGIGNCKEKVLSIPETLGGYTVTEIGQHAFEDCDGLESVKIGDGVTSIGGGAFEYCDGLKSVTIGGGVTSILWNTFYDCDALTSITLPSSLTSIGSAAFKNCDELTNIYITDVKAWCKLSGGGNIMCEGSVDKKIYCDGELLTELAIPDDVTSIGWCAFYNYGALKSVTFGKGVSSIGREAFFGCGGLEHISVANGNITYSAADDCLIEIKKKKLVLGCQNSVIPADGSVTEIAENAFYGCTGLTSVEIPNTVEKIAGSTFYGCTGLTSVKIADSVTEIAENAFYGCIGLTDIALPKGMTKIGDGAFGKCSGLTEFTVPASITSLGANLFDGTNVSKIYYNASAELDDNSALRFAGITEVVFGGKWVPVSALRDCTNVKHVKIGDGVTAIKEYAFAGCGGLETIEIPDSVTSVVQYAFQDCEKLKYTVYDNAKYLGDSENPYRVLVEAKNTDCKTCSVHDDTKLIACYAFYGCNELESVKIGKNVEIIESAFYGCEKLTSVEIPNGVSDVNSATFYGCSGLTNVTIGSDVTWLGWELFNGCNLLKSVTFNGTKEAWAAIKKDAEWNTGSFVTVIHCTDGDITL